MSDHKLVYTATTDSDEESFFRGELGTTLPTSATDALVSDLEGHGWMGEEGFRVNITRDTTKHRAFSGRVVKTTQDSYESTVKVTFFEQSPNVLATVFGDANVDVDISGGHRKITVRQEEDPLPLSSFVIRTVDGDRTVLHVIPEGRIVTVDEYELRHDGIWSYTVEIDCFKPPTGTNPDNPAAINVYYDEPSVASGT
jgi:hypothetical protein